ncbi:MAG: hypothetical protein EBV86_03385 [Marivivens sp.]|nr:hypothetical protein [Marivivens sp.]
MTLYAQGFSVEYDRLDATPIGGDGKKCGAGYISRNKQCRMTKGRVKSAAFGKKSNKEILQLENDLLNKPKNKDGSAKISPVQAGGLVLTPGTKHNLAARMTILNMRGKDLKASIKRLEKSSNPEDFALAELAKRERFNRRANVALSMGLVGAGAALLMQPKD